MPDPRGKKKGARRRLYMEVCKIRDSAKLTIYILNIDYTNKSHLTQILIAVITIISYNIHTKLRPLIPHLLSVRERVDAGGWTGRHGSHRVTECSGPQGRTRREGYTTHTGPRWDGDGNACRRRGRTALGPAKDVRVRAYIRSGTCSWAID